eukprot:UN32851
MERIKVMQQTGGGYKEKKSIMETARIIKSQGYGGFWRGNFINSLRVFPSRGILFATNDFYKENYARIGGYTKTHPLIGFVGGASAGATATICTYPMDLIRTRIAGVQKETPKFMTVARDIGRSDGFRGYYRGLILTLCNVVPYSGIAFSTYNICKDQLGLSNFVSGAISGSLTGTVTFPIDTVRRLLQASGSSHMKQYSGFFDASKDLYKTHGIKRFSVALV